MLPWVLKDYVIWIIRKRSVSNLQPSLKRGKYGNKGLINRLLRRRANGWNVSYTSNPTGEKHTISIVVDQTRIQLTRPHRKTVSFKHVKLGSSSSKYGDGERRSQEPREAPPPGKYLESTERPGKRHFSVNYWCENGTQRHTFQPRVLNVKFLKFKIFI